MQLSLRYHNGTYELELPSRKALAVIGQTFPAPLRDLEAALAAALDAPVGAAPLRKLLPRSGGVSILISDLTRGSGTGKTLAFLLKFLEENGAGPERVTVILALGKHRAHRASELETHLGHGVVERWKVIEHDAGDRLSLSDVGMTPAGTLCLFNTRVADSALVIALGTVSFHYFAGFTGARKLILPGVAGEGTILANHRLSLKKDPGKGLSDGCRCGNLDGNPVHEDMLAGARLLGGRVFAINSVAGEGGDVAFINAGELDASHRKACDFLTRYFRVPIDRLYGAVILSAGGFPRDINLLQSHKALRHASYALEEGGLMLAAAACSEGVGSDSYRDAFREGRNRVPDSVRKGYTLNSQTAMSTYVLAGSHSIYLRSMMPEATVLPFGFCPWNDDYANYLLEGISDEDIIVMVNASQFLPWKG